MFQVNMLCVTIHGGLCRGVGPIDVLMIVLSQKCAFAQLLSLFINTETCLALSNEIRRLMSGEKAQCDQLTCTWCRKLNMGFSTTEWHCEATIIYCWM